MKEDEKWQLGSTGTVERTGKRRDRRMRQKNPELDE